MDVVWRAEMLWDGSRGRVWNWIFRTSRPLEKILRELDKQTIPEFTETGRSTADVSGVTLVRSRHWAVCNVK